jgi:hypothetical protein
LLCFIIQIQQATHSMENLRLPIYGSTLYLAIYTLGASTGAFTPPLIGLLFGLSPLLVIWMVYVVLRKGVYNGPDFEDQFYEDYAAGGDKS